MTIIKQFRNWQQILALYSLLKKKIEINSIKKDGKDPGKSRNVKFTY